MKKPYLFLLAALLMWSEPVLADDFGRSAVAEALLTQARAGVSENARPTQTIQAKNTHTPYEIQEEMPADVDSLMARVTEQNAAIVEEYQALLQKDPLNAQAPQWLGQIAEFHWQMAHYDYLRARRAWMASLENCDFDSGNCPAEPVADYHEAIADYRKVLQQYPTYEKLDDVLFRLGDALIRNNQSKEGVGYLHRLTQSYPDYREIDAAYLAMGEFYFGQKNTGTAQAAYTKIVETWPNSRFYRYAQYKLAWTYLNLADEESYRTAIQLFKSVVESINVTEDEKDGQVDENRLNAGVVTFRNQALNDLSVTYAELPDGWMEARDYLKAKLPPDKARAKLIQLAGILDNQAKYEESIALYGELLAERPSSADVPDLMKRQIAAYQSSNRMNEAAQANEAMIAQLLPGSAWHEANASDAALLARVDRDNASNIYQLAMTQLIAGSEAKSTDVQMAAYASSERWLALYLQHYPNGDHAFDVTFSHAFVMDEQSDYALTTLRKNAKKADFAAQAADILPKLQQTAAEYQKIVDWQGNESQAEQTKVAANREVFVYANILATEDPTWSVVNSAKSQGFVEEKRDSAALEAVPLTPPEADFVRSAEQYADRYPVDEETPAFLWRAAEIYRTKFHYNQAAERFDAIITHFPDHQYAAVSVGSMFELYNKAKNYAKIEYWAAWLIEKKNFKHYTQSELEAAAAYAIDAQAASQAEAGQFAAAGDTILRIENRYGARRDLVVPASFKAIRYAEADHNYVVALERVAHLKELGLSEKEQAHADFVAGENNVRLARFSDAANAFDASARAYFAQNAPTVTPELASKSKKSVKKSEPVDENTHRLDAEARVEAARSTLFAAQIFASTAQKDRGLALMDQYLAANQASAFDLYKKGEDFVVLTPDEAQNTPDAALMLNSDKVTLVAASMDVPDNARTRLENALGPKPDLKNHAELRAPAFALYELATDQDWPELSEKMAKNFADASDAMTNAEQARAAYLNGRRIQRDFERVVLEFPVRTLKKRIEEKAKLRVNAEKAYREAIGFKIASVSSAAAYQLAQMALSFRDAFKALPMPKELENDPDAQDEYTMWLEDELIYPAEDAASSLLSLAQEVTIQFSTHTSFARKTASSLAELQPDVYPVIEASQVKQ